MNVDKIFEEAKSKFIYKTDKENFGHDEYWATFEELNKTPSELLGDCDDFAAYCVHRLRLSNEPARFVLCKTESGEYHLVAESNGLILDNRQLRVIHNNDLPYEWLSISGYKPGDSWRKITKYT